uniref:Uncharacterized protein n=1 Tax=Oryza punctata TaxID=4537 RepID=A0A0E0KDX6_ORYPU
MKGSCSPEKRCSGPTAVAMASPPPDPGKRGGGGAPCVGAMCASTSAGGFGALGAALGSAPPARPSSLSLISNAHGD